MVGIPNQLPELAFDCKLSCFCEGEVERCPNVQAFGAAALEYARLCAKRVEHTTKESEHPVIPTVD